MPLGSSSEAPVMRPGPRRARNPFFGAGHVRPSGIVGVSFVNSVCKEPPGVKRGRTD